jgi:hypothetical protein
MSPLTSFAIQWVQTRADYDTLIAKTIYPDWAKKHLPVLSQGNDHMLYTGYDPMEPQGMLIKCHQGCGVENRIWKPRPATYKIICRKCGSTCSINKHVLEDNTFLGSRGLLKIPFPQKQAPTEWTFANTRLMQKTEDEFKASPTANVLASLPVPPPSTSWDHLPQFLDPGHAVSQSRGGMTVSTPSTVSPTPSHSPSPSTSSPHPTRLPTIRIPPRTSRSFSRGPQHHHSSLEAPPIARAHSTPGSMEHEHMNPRPSGQATRHSTLDNYPTIFVSTRKRQKRE